MKILPADTNAFLFLMRAHCFDAFADYPICANVKGLELLLLSQYY